MKQKISIVALEIIVAFAVVAFVATIPGGVQSVARADNACPTGSTVCQACNASCPTDPGQCVAGCTSPFGCISTATFTGSCLPRHKACVNQSCQVVTGVGSDTCTADAQCIIITTSTAPAADSNTLCYLANPVNPSCVGGSNCTLDPGNQSCSIKVTQTASASSADAACTVLGASSLASVLQQNVMGVGVQTNPSLPGYGTQIPEQYNSDGYATQNAASLLAQCVGGTVRLVSHMANGSPFLIPPELDVILPNGGDMNAGQALINLIIGNAGNVPNWKQNYVAHATVNAAPAATNPATGAGTTSGTASQSNSNSTTKSISAIISGIQSSVLTYRASAAAQAQAQANAAIGNAGGTVSSNAANQSLLASLQSSLRNINNSLTTTTGISQANLTSVAGVVASIAQIIQLLQATNQVTAAAGGATSGATATGTGATASGINFTNPVIGGLGTSTFRYMAIQTMRLPLGWICYPPTSKCGGWTKMNEIEAYDASGTKVQPAHVYVSGSYTGYNSDSIGPQALTDGSINTSWNSGDAAPNPWIIVDYGSPQTFSKLRFYSSADGGGAERVYISPDAKNYSELWRFSTDYTDLGRFPVNPGPKWNEYAFTPYVGDPSATVTINGTTSTTVNLVSGSSIAYNWTVSNADIVRGEFTGGTDYAIMSDPGYPVDYCAIAWLRSSVLPFPGLDATGPGIAPSINASDLETGSRNITRVSNNDTSAYQCSYGRTYHLTISATQSRTGKTATSTATLKIPGNMKMIDLWSIQTDPYNRPANYVGPDNMYVDPGTSTSTIVWTVSQIHGSSLSTPADITVSVDSVSPGISAAYTKGGNLAYTVFQYQLGSLAVTVSPGTPLPGKVVLKSTFAGDTKYTTVNVNPIGSR